MNKHFNIEDADHESDWKDLTIMRLLSEVSDLEDKIDNAIEYIDRRDIDWGSEEHDKLVNILKGNDEDEKD